MRELTKLALSSLVLLAGLDPSVGTLQISPAGAVAHQQAARPRVVDVRARPGVAVHRHRHERSRHERSRHVAD